MSIDDFNPNTSIVIAMSVKDGILTRPDGHESIQAEVIGQWAVHCTCGKTKLRLPYSVTHIPTGLRVVGDIELEAARELANRLHESVPAFETNEGEAWLQVAPIIKGVVYEKVAA
jgi:hypothetical protein